MQFVIILIGVSIAFLGCWGLISPATFASWMRTVSSPGGYYLASGLRVVLAVLFWFAAEISRLPLVLQTLAGVSLAAAIGLMIIGYPRYRRLVGWSLRLGRVRLRIGMVFAIAFGCFLIWLVS